MVVGSCDSNLAKFRWSARLAVTILIVKLLHALNFVAHGPQTIIKVIVTRLRVVQIEYYRLLAAPLSN
jgi:hypothetical protein